MGYDKRGVVAKHRLHDTDTGSARVQVALLTERINSLTEHFRTHLKDHHGAASVLVRGLTKVTCVALLGAVAANILTHATAWLA